MEYVIDAKGRPLGRVATEAAIALRGKNMASFAPHLVPRTRVRIVHVGKLSIPEAKKQSKLYTRYTGYPSGLRKEKMSEIVDKHGLKEVVRRAIHGMLPANKLRSKIMKGLIVEL